MKYTPHHYQEEAAQFLIDNECAGLLLDPGLGKTSTTLFAIKELKARGRIDKTIIVSPLKVTYGVWPAEIKKWDEFKDLTYTILHGHKREQRWKEDVDIYLINYDGLRWLRAKLKKMTKTKERFDMLVFDESTCVKDTSTKRFQHARVLIKRFERRVILTGTPAPNSLLDLYGQIFMLDGGKALGRNMEIHKDLYWRKADYNGFVLELRDEGCRQEILHRTAPLVKRMSSDMYLELPDLIIQDIMLDLPAKVEPIYREMEADYLSMIDEGVLVAANAAVASGKCRQICSGGIYFEIEPTVREVKHLHDVKTEATVDLVMQLGGNPVLICYEFKHDLERLQEVFPDAPHLGGGVPELRQLEIQDEWNAGKIPVLFCQPQTCSYGLNLQSAGSHHMIWYTLTWSNMRYLQMIARLHRQGQENAVIVHRLIMDRTIDMAVKGSLCEKGFNQTSFMESLYDYRQEMGL